MHHFSVKMKTTAIWSSNWSPCRSRSNVRSLLRSLTHWRLKKSRRPSSTQQLKSKKQTWMLSSPTLIKKKENSNRKRQSFTSK
jgi:hypothetical protein